eukprot:scaffold190465_cov17-Tisochrysis_lutea.AAC.2
MLQGLKVGEPVLKPRSEGSYRNGRKEKPNDGGFRVLKSRLMPVGNHGHCKGNREEGEGHTATHPSTGGNVGRECGARGA